MPIEGLPGRLGLTFAPGKRAVSSVYGLRWDRDLDIDLRDLRLVHGTDVLVALIRDYEYELLGIPDLVERAEAHGMTVRRFEIEDVSVPEPASEGAFRELIDELDAHLAAGRNLTVHCRGGLGRSGLVAACVLVRHGIGASEAIARVRAARPGAVETHGQERYVHAYAAGIDRASPILAETPQHC